MTYLEALKHAEKKLTALHRANLDSGKVEVGAAMGLAAVRLAIEKAEGPELDNFIRIGHIHTKDYSDTKGEDDG